MAVFYFGMEPRARVGQMEVSEIDLKRLKQSFVIIGRKTEMLF